MLALARHNARFRSAYPTDRLLVVFEIDGRIVDQRHIVVAGSSTTTGCTGPITSAASRWPRSTWTPRTSNASSSVEALRRSPCGDGHLQPPILWVPKTQFRR
jgi:hypothetical protein